MRNLFKYFIEHPKLVNLFLVLVIIMGSLSFINLKRDSIPNVDFKMMFVSTIYPGAAPEDVEINVTIPIEEQIQRVTGIKDLQSFSTENISTIFIEIDPDAKDVEEVKRDIYKAVDRVANLPPQVKDKPLVIELKSEVFPVFEIAVSGNGNTSELNLRKYVDILDKKIRLLAGVSGTKLVGYRKREIRVEVDPQKLEDQYVSLAEAMAAIKATNVRLSGGTIQSLAAKKKVITLSQFDNPLEVKEVIVRSAFSGQRLIIKDLAKVSDSFEDESRLIKTNGNKCINIVVDKKATADAVKVAGSVSQLLKKFNQDLPQGIKAQVVKDYSVYVKTMLSVVISNALFGFFLVVICLMIFLDIRVAFWTAMGIPFSLLVAFYFMPIYDVAVTTQALLAFVIVLGMLVDDAIVVAEHIFSYREEGLDAVEASLRGVSEVFWPVCATVATTIAAFLPILLMGGIWGDFIRAIPIVITVTLLASLFEAAFILPAHLAGTKLKQKGKPKLLVFLENWYRRNLIRVLKKKNLFIGLFILIFIFCTAVILPKLGFVLFPSSDNDVVQIKIETPKGTPLYETEHRVTEIEKIITATVPENILASYVTTIGEKGTDMWDTVSGMTQDHWARIAVNLIPAQKRKISAKNLAQQLQVKLEKLKQSDKFTDVAVIALRGGPPSGSPIDLTFIGNNDEIRTNLADELVTFLKNTDGVYDLDRNDEKGLKELNIKLNYNLMSDLGITALDVAQVVRAAIAGTVVTSIRKEGEEIDFRVMLAEPYRNNPEYIKELTIPNRFGKLISLGSFIRFEEKISALGIPHMQGDRSVKITAEIDQKKLNSKEFNLVLKNKFAPLALKYPGFRLEFGGEEKIANDSLSRFFRSMIIALVVIYIILVVLFNSFTEPMIVMTAIPFGLVGVILAFALHREPLSFLALIGILGLSGVVVNNSLVMLEFLNNEEERVCDQGEKLTLEHIADAAKLRFRPIILTTVTTVAGIIPSLYGFLGGRVDFLFPLLLALSWGLLFSTFITLFLIPCFYLVEKDVTCWLSSKLKK